jgi:hypothetical protein
MLFCPTCKTEYEPPATHCKECGNELVDSPPLQATAGCNGIELVELARFSNVSEAEMIKELLEANDIEAALRGEADPIGVVSGAERTALLVEEKDLQRAQEIYGAYFAGDTARESLNDQE